MNIFFKYFQQTAVIWRLKRLNANIYPKVILMKMLIMFESDASPSELFLVK